VKSSILDDERIRMRTMDLLATNDEFFEAAWSHAALGAAAPLPVTDSTYLSWDALNAEVKRCGFRSRALNPYGTDLDSDATFLDFNAIDPLRGDADRAVAVMQEAVGQGFSVIFSTAGSRNGRTLCRNISQRRFTSHCYARAKGNSN